ncbi:hypothetical protein AYY17_09775 [Morganella psychrotolerans]|uniref:Uncharacterized protein n=1 Tax=Morganella psychrotolerans TaxID=368603 RepID=A0A1B8H416_9GAMM|nr:hypothetical protein AYY17_09775 [Morganella psychrotolerans]
MTDKTNLAFKSEQQRVSEFRRRCRQTKKVSKTKGRHEISVLKRIYRHHASKEGKTEAAPAGQKKTDAESAKAD